ncbi:hypothetical protein IZ6_07340 [Terrihabitans soli]|uniref:ASCH domain-containing protein n=1 Tax=Terrihabitans soli TaxID=708113 RepID=A0A6S6QM49_9HYPH|nr:ASCH domain-containing protein [Terrihabitans soli]BCJ89999.1 hypothetical protein IZ6_07340 [Terrihabitans soli]
MPDLFGPTPAEQPGRMLKALSVRQPWACGLLYLGKPVENRTWRTEFRGRVLLHAAKAEPDEIEIESVRQLGAAAIARLREECAETGDHFDFPQLLDRGGIIGSIEIFDCVTHCPSPWFVGPYGFLCRDPRPLPFTPFRGQLGFLDVPAEAVKGLDF